VSWETILASVSIEIGDHTYSAGIIRRDDRYFVHKAGLYQEFDGGANDNTATAAGIAQIGLLLGQELQDFAKIKGPQAEQI
jgi:hypothetical protein